MKNDRRVAWAITLCVCGAACAQDLRQGEFIVPADSTAQAFGHSVLMDRDFAAIGTTWNGTIHLFARDAGAWVENGMVTNERWTAKGLGVALDSDGRTLVAGAPYPFICDPIEGPSSSGEVVVFRRNDQGGIEFAQTLRHDYVDRLDRFGEAVAIDGDILVAAARYDNEAGHSAGSAYVFRDVGGEWVQEAKLIGDLTDESDILGWSVDVENGRVVLGAPFRSDNGYLHSGSALVFEQVGGEWAQVARLVSPDPRNAAYFGVTVALQGDAIVVGETGMDSAYAFTRQADGTWTDGFWLDPDFPTYLGGDYEFGAKIEFAGDTVYVSAPRFRQGMVNAYSTSTWAMTQQILPTGFRNGEQVGSAMSYSGGDLLLGARYAQGTGLGLMMTGGRDAGSLGGGTQAGCDADVNHDGAVDSRDFVEYLGMWSASDARADTDGDGLINTSDVLMFLGMWSAGC